MVFHAQVAKENGQFDMDDVVHGISSKMVSRHRHVFGGEEAETADDVMKIWEDVKKKRKDLRPILRHLRMFLLIFLLL